MILLRVLLVLVMSLVMLPLHAEVPVPRPVSPVIDMAGFITPAERQGLENELLAFHRQHGSQIAILIVPTVEPETPFDYGTRVMESWKLGRQGVDDGVLLLVAVQERTSQLLVGRGLEGILPDVTAKRILHQVLSPRLARGERAAGLTDTIKAVESVVLKEGLPAPAAKPKGKPQQGQDYFWGAMGLLALAGLWRRVFGRLAGSVVSGSLIMAVAYGMGAGLMLAVILGGAGFLLSLVGIAFISIGGSGGRGGGNNSGGWGGGGGDYGGGGSSDKW